MKAGIVVEKQKIDIVEVEEPDIAAHPSGAIKIKTELSTICGSDIPKFMLEQNEYPGRLGTSIHEVIGTVAQSNSDRFKPGDRVLALPTAIGGCAEYFVSQDDFTIPLLDFHSPEQILMSQPLGTVIWALRRLGSLIDKDVVILGAGPIGQMTSHAVSNLGAKTITVVDLVDFRLEVAKRMGATATINAATEDPVQRIEAITEGRMADIAFEMVGHNTETMNTCIDTVKRMGTVLCFGVPDDAVVPINYQKVVLQNINLIGSWGPEIQADFPLAMRWIAEGRIDVSPIITHRMPFTEVQKGFEIFTQQRDRAIKIVLVY
ncbi:MAG: zinc-binding dehydrogenase [Desulfobacterales bacterium]